MIHAHPVGMDYARWAEEVDLVTNDHYTIAADPRRYEDLAFSADRTRGIANGRPWLLLEHAAGSVNWQDRNRAKAPGELARDSLTHVAAGSDGAMFFQWRQSLAGGEQFHSGMVPHAGTATRVHQEVRQLGAALAQIAAVRGATVVDSRVAILWSHDAFLAFESGRKPTDAISFDELPVAIHAEVTARGIGVDVLPRAAALERYDLVVVPNQFLLAPATVAALSEYVRAGGHLLVSYLSGIVDETNRVLPGGYPGALRELLGIRVTEFLPLLAGQTIHLSSGATVTDWAEDVELAGAQAVDHYADGPAAASPSITVHRFGQGAAWYLSAHVDRESLSRIVGERLVEAGLDEPSRPGLVVKRRSSPTGSWLFAVNSSASAYAVTANGHDLLTDREFAGTVPPGGVVVLREPLATSKYLS
jgi:beta-galactosidase